jgi:cyclic beta-1,2-glucan synthetase
MTEREQQRPDREHADPGNSRAVPGSPGRTPAERIQSLAHQHRAIVRPPRRWTPDLDLKAVRLCFDRLYASVAENAQAGRTGTRAEEWLLDNRHIVEQTIEDIRKALPPAYLRQLPLVAVEGRPEPVIRVQELARNLARESARPVDIEWLEHVLDGYQDTAVLTIGELWAFPAFLRLEILNNLVGDAGECLERMESLRAEGVSADRLAREIQSDDVAGDIVGLRHLDTHDWRESFERLSRVDRRLRLDPSRAYDRLEFESRDRYRGAVEQLARGSCYSELEVAAHVVALCDAGDASDHRARHAGYYLVSGGRPALERNLGYRLSPRRRFARWLLHRPALIYFGLLAGLALAPLLAMAGHLLWRDAHPLAVSAVTILAAVPVTGLAVAMLNGLLAWLLSPRRLPKLNFERGIPAEYRSAVVMPILLGGAEDVDQALERMEINYLNNDDRQLVYAILSDWADAPEAAMPDDDILLERAAAGVRGLNQRYGRNPEHGPFMLLHRRRLWNEAEGCWMGWERKRGKLAEFNRLLAGDRDTSYDRCIGDRQALAGVEFVITLDADTHLPPAAARRLVGTIAHPLNRAVVDRERGLVTAGYSILQPRLEIDPDSTQSTRFTEVFAGDTTLDLYTHATSDVYHDLFGEGIYAGKGLYDWRAFEHTMKHRIPENALLSHDLLEGVHGRVGLVSDVVMLEQYPGSALAYMRRLHRWIRGDWQLLPWLGPLVPSTTGTWFRNPLSAIHRWKIIDNLRRSVQAPAVLALLVLAWLGLIPGPAWLWTLLVVSFLAAPLIAEIFSIAGRGMARPATLPQRLREAPHALRDHFERWILSLVLLPFESYVVADAVGRTLFRLFITRRRLLEWTTAAHVHRRIGADIRAGGGNRFSAIWREMWISPTLGALGFAVVLTSAPAAVFAAAPLLLAWVAAPQVIWWMDRPLYAPPAPAVPAVRRRLRRVARRTWLFFERFVDADNHWLPPDNYQEEPRVALARRTSPTNIGMALASTLAAHDLGLHRCRDPGGAGQEYVRRHVEPPALPGPLAQLV